MQYDCIVVGSGSVGCVTAPRLSDTTDKSVILKMENDRDYRGDDFPGSEGPLPVRRPRRQDWLPFNTPFYDACVRLNIPEHPDQNAPECNTAVSPRPMNNIDGVPMSASLTFPSVARHRLNLTVRGNIHAHRIILEGNRAADSPTRADFQKTPTLMTSEHRPASVSYDGSGFHFGLSIGLQNAVSAGGLSLQSTDPSVQPALDYQLFSDPYDRRRMRQAIRKALEIADKSPFRDFIVARLNPTDADLVSDDALDNWFLRNACTRHHIAGTCKMGPVTDATAVVN